MLKLSRSALFAAALGLLAMPSASFAAMSIGAPAGAAGGVEVKPGSSVAGMGAELKMPKIKLVGASMSEDEFRDAIGAGFLQHADDLAHLDAKRISIPELRLTFTGGDAAGTAVYRDIVLDDVEDGVAGTVSIGSSQSINPEGTTSYGRITETDLDIGALLAFIGAVPGDDDGFAKTYSSFKIDGGSFSSKEATCSIGPFLGASGAVRPSEVALGDAIEAIKRAAGKPDNPAQDDIGTIGRYFIGIVQHVRSEPLSVGAIDCQGLAAGQPFSFGIGGITMGGMRPSLFPAFKLNDLSVDAGKEGNFELGRFELKPTDWSEPVAAIEANLDRLSPDWFGQNARKLVPFFGGFSLSGLAFDVPDPEARGSRVKASVDKFDVTLADYVNGIPSRLETSASGIDAPLPAKSSDETVKLLRSLGLERLDFGYRVAAAWDPAAETIRLEDATLSGDDLGSIKLTSVVGNATKELFDEDTPTLQRAASALTFKKLTIDVTDEGFGDLLAQYAKVSRMVPPSEPDVRTKLAGQAEGGVLVLLGASDDNRALAAAVGDFVAGRTDTIHITITAKDKAGIPFDTFSRASNNPAELAKLLTITGGK